MAQTHPFARKFISAIVRPANFAVSSKTSPQAGFSNCAAASGDAKVPALRGF